MIRLIVWFLMLTAGIIGGYLIDSVLFKSTLESIPFHIVSFVIGAILLMVVLRISRNTGRTLAKYGRKGNVKRLDTNVLVKKGVYKYMRHPMHLGLLFMPLSLAFIIGSLSFILFIAPFEMLLMIIMIKTIEEPQTIKKFKDEYIAYKKEVPMFCLKIECLKALLKPYKE